MVRQARVVDAPLLARIHAAGFDEPWPTEAVASLLNSAGVVGLITLEESGFILARIAADEAEVLTLAVTPEARRHGRARALLEAAAREVAAAGARTLFLEVGTENSAALALYLSAGFEAVGRRAGYYRRGPMGDDAVILRRALNSAGDGGYARAAPE